MYSTERLGGLDVAELSGLRLRCHLGLPGGSSVGGPGCLEARVDDKNDGPKDGVE